MAKGKKCPYCGNYMNAEFEKYESAGTFVTYVCNNVKCKHKEKVFEGK